MHFTNNCRLHSSSQKTASCEVNAFYIATYEMCILRCCSSEAGSFKVNVAFRTYSAPLPSPPPALEQDAITWATSSFGRNYRLSIEPSGY